MTSEEKKFATHFCESLWAHDAWMWGNTCSELLNREIDFGAPAKLERTGEYYKITVVTRDGRELEMSYKEGGWSLGYVIR